MKTPSEDLMHEHKAILIALNVIEQMVRRVQNDKGIESKDIEEMIGFLKVFADKCHHGKEEDFLFPALEEAGVKNQAKSKRSRFITLFHTAIKSFTNFSLASALP
jgi:hemerythrin-like domain-containing protein